MSKPPLSKDEAVGTQQSPAPDNHPFAADPGPKVVELDDDEEDYDLHDSDEDDEEFLHDIIIGQRHSYSDKNWFADSINAERCTFQESTELRLKLRTEGASKFIESTITENAYTAKKLLTAFGITPPPFWEGSPDTKYYELLGFAVTKELSQRYKLNEYNTIEDAVELIRTRKNIMVITGAGISTNLGVPDFRSKKTGFYDKLRKLGYENPEDIFDINEFEYDPSIFYTHSAETLPHPGKSTPTHAFIKLLDDREQLLTNYTQNIDNIEGNVGISPHKLIQCHGSWATFTCRKCQHREPGQQYYDAVKQHRVPKCPACLAAQTSTTSAGKRKRVGHVRTRDKPWSDDEEDVADTEPGIMKPDITFFGEKLPDAFFNRFKEHDFELVDLVIIIGTSMMVSPVSEIPVALRPTVPHIYISRCAIEHTEFDITLLGDCDLITSELARRAGWQLTHPMLPATPKELEIVAEDEAMGIWHVRPKGEPDPAVVAQQLGQAEV